MWEAHERQACLTTHSHSDDPTIRLLYATAKSVMADIITCTSNFEETLSHICSTNTNFLERIQKEVQKLPGLTVKVDKQNKKAIEYNNRLKRKLSQPEFLDEDSSVEIPPLKRLPCRDLSSQETLLWCSLL